MFGPRQSSLRYAFGTLREHIMPCQGSEQTDPRSSSKQDYSLSLNCRWLTLSRECGFKLSCVDAIAHAIVSPWVHSDYNSNVSRSRPHRSPVLQMNYCETIGCWVRFHRRWRGSRSIQFPSSDFPPRHNCTYRASLSLFAFLKPYPTRTATSTQINRHKTDGFLQYHKCHCTVGRKCNCLRRTSTW